jgi:hypothetical protein
MLFVCDRCVKRGEECKTPGVLKPKRCDRCGLTSALNVVRPADTARSLRVDAPGARIGEHAGHARIS